MGRTGRVHSPYPCPSVDVDGDGRWDAYTVRGGANGGLEVVADIDGDGRVDFVGHDVDRDGVIDSADYDNDGDGRLETQLTDDNGDGWMDRQVTRTRPPQSSRHPGTTPAPSAFRGTDGAGRTNRQ